MKLFGKNSDGVHLMSPLHNEYTLCGDAFDIDTEEGCETLHIRGTKEKVITCIKCIIIIKECRNIKCRKI